MSRLDELLRYIVEVDASDLHLKVGNPPIIRLLNDLKRLDQPPITEEEMDSMLFGILNEERKRRLMEFRELDLSYAIEGLARFRVNMYWSRGTISGEFRLIPFQIKTIDELRIPKVTEKLAMLPRGLIIVTGPTGCGKSTSLAAMINHINLNANKHIITIEDPIEYVHQDHKCIINQRERGTDTHSFADALRHVMRQNPDIILVGEMRDLETIQLAITAAETGHLVFSTLHTVDAAQTIDRMVDVFEPDQQEQIRTQVSVTLQAVISQQLLQTADGKARVAAFEILVATPAVRTLIREGKTHQLYMDIQTGAEHGMQTLDASLIGLMKDGLIDYESAIAKCSNLPDFKRRAEKLGIVEAASVAN
ncbi:MAG: type IV pilus twitching motility protein PilT [Armatimonadetes bacterium]|nr:type IV pilus twitching motility protein PilT [Armatimonadota bacterium]